jgi:hypothetical protein
MLRSPRPVEDMVDELLDKAADESNKSPNKAASCHDAAYTIILH